MMRADHIHLRKSWGGVWAINARLGIPTWWVPDAGRSETRGIRDLTRSRCWNPAPDSLPSLNPNSAVVRDVGQCSPALFVRLVRPGMRISSPHCSPLSLPPTLAAPQLAGLNPNKSFAFRSNFRSLHQLSPSKNIFGSLPLFSFHEAHSITFYSFCSSSLYSDRICASLPPPLRLSSSPTRQIPPNLSSANSADPRYDDYDYRQDWGSTRTLPCDTHSVLLPMEGFHRKLLISSVVIWW